MTQWPRKWKLVGASVQGVSHIKSGTPCQDAHKFNIECDEILIAAVADGAGSASFSADGARFAVEQFLENFGEGLAGELVSHHSEKPQRKLLIQELDYLQARLMAYAAELSIEAREFATTLLLIIAEPNFVAVAQIGDGAVVIGDADGNIFALTKPQNGEHANETTFLTSPDAVENAEIVVWHGKVKHLAVFTDGLQRLALQMPEGTAHAPFFKPFFAFVENMTDADKAQQELEKFLYSPRITERTDDDLTLLLAYLSDV